MIRCSPLVMVWKMSRLLELMAMEMHPVAWQELCRKQRPEQMKGTLEKPTTAAWRENRWILDWNRD